jgi:putative tryptophan/tyrosine transport system substrate-binding protein
MTRRRIGLLVTITFAMLMAPVAATAQPPATIPRIGILCTDRCLAPPLEAYEEGRAFLDGLRELGYRQERDFVLIFRNAGTSYKRLPELAADLVQLPVDVILALEGAAVARAAKHATRTVPVVMVGVPDAVS